ncbi:CobW family GTP-binding protein [Rhodospirillales bacterium]|nr:CobW family GTP-binding protein [Rhodospirillales bacterium]
MDSIRKVPTTILTGFFGVGKTTAIKSMLTRKPPHEIWAVLINEFGEVSVDQAAVEKESISDNVIIQEIPGGCMCCMTNVPMEVGILEILRRVKPDRLLIEPTGIGHPAGILDELRGPQLSTSLNVKAVICLVDPRHALDSRIQSVNVFNDQIHLADILVASKADIANADELKFFYEWAEQLFPPKLRIIEARHGDLELLLLDLDIENAKAPLFPHAHGHVHRERAAKQEVIVIEQGNPHRALNQGLGYRGCGWIFSAEEVFDSEMVVDLLGPPGLLGLPKGAIIERLKGVFRVEKGWVLVNRVNGEFTLSEIAYRNDSRLEVIVSEDLKPDWDELERRLIKCSIS